MHGLRVASLAVAGFVALTATGVRIGDHPAYVRVVLDFNRTLPQRQVEFDELTRTMAVLHVAHPGLKSRVAVRSGYGVRVALQSGGQQLHIAATFARRHFKYVSYAVVGGNRLAIDLWKSDPQSVAAEIRDAGCLALGSWTLGTHSVVVRGTEHGVFENTFQVVVRGDNGAVLGRKTITQGQNWKTAVPYKSSHRQKAMLEAVAFSPKDGALACIAQVHVALPG